MSDREVIMDTKQRKMDNVTETQARPPRRNPIPSDWFDDEEDDQDNQARVPWQNLYCKTPNPALHLAPTPVQTCQEY